MVFPEYQAFAFPKDVVFWISRIFKMLQKKLNVSSRRSRRSLRSLRKRKALYQNVVMQTKSKRRKRSKKTQTKVHPIFGQGLRCSRGFSQIYICRQSWIQSGASVWITFLAQAGCPKWIFGCTITKSRQVTSNERFGKRNQLRVRTGCTGTSWVLLTKAMSNLTSWILLLKEFNFGVRNNYFILLRWQYHSRMVITTSIPLERNRNPSLSFTTNS